MKAVIDTNVLLVANGDHPDVSADCECVRRLQAMQAGGVAVVDDGFRILGEYLHKTKVNPPKGVGDVFLKWLLREANNPSRVEQVPLTEMPADCFAEFPDPLLEPTFTPRTESLPRSHMLILESHPSGRRPTANGWTGGKH